MALSAIDLEELGLVVALARAEGPGDWRSRQHTMRISGLPEGTPVPLDGYPVDVAQWHSNASPTVGANQIGSRRRSGPADLAAERHPRPAVLAPGTTLSGHAVVSVVWGAVSIAALVLAVSMLPDQIAVTRSTMRTFGLALLAPSLLSIAVALGARQRIAESSPRVHGKWLATAGVVLGLFGLAAITPVVAVYTLGPASVVNVGPVVDLPLFPSIELPHLQPDDVVAPG